MNSCTTVWSANGFCFQQTVDHARHLMKHFDENLGKPLPEKDYGGNCYLYDPSHEDPFHNIKVSYLILVLINCV